MNAINLDIPVADIIQGQRLRGVHKETVARLIASIKAQGLLQPIGVKVRGTKYKLIWGAHRLAAFKVLLLTMINHSV